MTEINVLHSKYQLTEREVLQIGERIIERYTFGIVSVVKPKVIILGGQPGAGKSELIKIARTVWGNNSVICNADEYRDYHPKSEEIKRLYEKFYPEITAAYSQPWNNRLRKHCEDNRFNFILETTFSSGALMNKTIRELRDKGCEVSIMILAVNKKRSYLGTQIRYEKMQIIEGFGRKVDKVAHDDKYEKIRETLALVQQAKSYNHLYIYGRAGRGNTKGKHNGLVLVSHNSKDPLHDYLTERDKELSVNDMREFMGDILQLIRMMIDRTAPHDELKIVLDTFETI